MRPYAEISTTVQSDETCFQPVKSCVVDYRIQTNAHVSCDMHSLYLAGETLVLLWFPLCATRFGSASTH